MRLLPILLPLLFAGCFGIPSGDPCYDYCEYICVCHAGEEGFDCDQCEVEYANSDAALQDECESTLTDLQVEDEAAGTGCSSDTTTADSGL